MNILEVINGERRASPEAIAAAIIEMEAKIPEFNQQFQKAERALVDREQANMLGKSVSAGEIDALEKKRDQADRQLRAVNDAVTKLRKRLLIELNNECNALQEEDRKLDAAIAAGADKVQAVAEEHYMGLLVCVMVKNGGFFSADEFIRCPFFPLERLTEIEKLVRDKFANLSKGPLLEQSRMVGRSAEVNSLLRQLRERDSEEIANRLIDVAREKALLDNAKK